MLWSKNTLNDRDNWGGKLEQLEKEIATGQEDATQKLVKRLKEEEL